MATDMKIETAEDFVRLRSSEDHRESWFAIQADLGEALCLEIIQRYPDMKKMVIHNKKVPLAILNLLADDPDETVRGHITMKRKLDTALFEKLAKDSSPNVRAGIIGNQKVPKYIIELLLDDENEYLRERAASRLTYFD